MRLRFIVLFVGLLFLTFSNHAGAGAPELVVAVSAGVSGKNVALSISVTNVGEKPVYLLSFAHPPCELDHEACILTVATDEHERGYYYSYNPEVVYVVPGQRVTLHWLVAGSSIQAVKCPKLLIECRVAYLHQLPKGMLTAQYVAENQSVARSKLVTCPPMPHW